jgi:hypothetical protein
MDKLPEWADLETAVGHLNRHDGLTATTVREQAGDVLRVRYGPIQTDFRVVTRPGRNNPFGQVLLLHGVRPDEAESLKTRHVNFIDSLGNAYLRGPNFLLWVTGRTPPQRARLDAPSYRVADVGPESAPRPELINRAFEPKGMQVVLVLLCRPETVALPYRELAGLADVAHGTVGHVISDLEALGYVAHGPAPRRRKRGPRRLINRASLLDEWARIFAKTVRHRYLIGRYRGLAFETVGTRQWNDYGGQLGGEFAADAITHYLRPETLTLYIDGDRPTAALLRDLRLQPDPGGPIELLRKFWKFDGAAERETDLVPLPLVYADLLAIGGARCLETADQVRERILADLEQTLA